MDVNDVCGSKPIEKSNRCLIGFQHGKKKAKMEEGLAAGPLGKDYGDGYKLGRELAFQQTGSKRKTKRNTRARKTRRTKKLNGGRK